MRSWRPIFITFILTATPLIGLFTIYGSETATGTVVSGHISIDTTWNLAGSPYTVVDNVIVDPGVTLTIDPGVKVEFDNRQFPPFLNMFVEGTLVAEGNESSMIQITRRLPGQPGLWGAIQVNSTGKMDIRYCNISYADSAIIVGSSSRSNVTNNIVTDSWGVLEPLGPVTPGHLFANNTFARSVLTLSSSNNTVIDNTFESGMAIYGDGNLVARNLMQEMVGYTWDSLTAIGFSTI